MKNNNKKENFFLLPNDLIRKLSDYLDYYEFINTYAVINKSIFFESCVSINSKRQIDKFIFQLVNTKFTLDRSILDETYLNGLPPFDRERIVCFFDRMRNEKNSALFFNIDHDDSNIYDEFVNSSERIKEILVDLNDLLNVDNENMLFKHKLVSKNKTIGHYLSALGDTWKGNNVNIYDCNIDKNPKIKKARIRLNKTISMIANLDKNEKEKAKKLLIFIDLIFFLFDLVWSQEEKDKSKHKIVHQRFVFGQEFIICDIVHIIFALLLQNECCYLLRAILLLLNRHDILFGKTNSIVVSRYAFMRCMYQHRCHTYAQNGNQWPNRNINKFVHDWIWFAALQPKCRNIFGNRMCGINLALMCVEYQRGLNWLAQF